MKYKYTQSQYLNLPRKLQRLFLGEYFEVSSFGRKPRLCLFMQPTEKGFNFLDIETNKCIFKHHFYQSKLKNHIDGNWFFIRNNILLNKKDGPNIQSTGVSAG